MRLKFNEKTKVNYERVVLSEKDDVKTLRHKKIVNLVIGEFMAVSAAAIIGCFAPAGAVLWLCIGAGLYIAGLIISDAGTSSLKTAIFVLPVAAAVLFSPLGFYRGFLYFINLCITLLNARFNVFIAFLTVGNCSPFNVLQFDAMLLMLVLWLIYLSLKTKRLWPASLLCIVLFAFIGFGGLKVSPIVCGALAFAWVYAWGQKTAGSGSIRKNLMLIVPLFAMIAIIVGIVYSNIPETDTRVASLRKGVSDTVKKVRFGEDTLPGGSMIYAAELGKGKETTLQIEFRGKPQELYLRGFVGGDFNGSEWEEPNESLYHGDNSGIISWLSKNGLEVPFQYGTYFSYTSIGKNSKVNSISVHNTGAYRKYVYAPYQSLAVFGGAQKLNNDEQLCSAGAFGARSYTIDVADAGDFRKSVMREDLDNTIEGSKEFSDAEAVYNAFVKENYLTVSDEEQQVIQGLFYGSESWKNKGLSEVTTQIRVILQSLTSYSQTAAYFDGASDFVSWFGEGNKDGNSAYYATMAVLAYRCAGIPARYVEGYFYSGAAADRLDEQGGNAALLTDADAHAWAEVYLDGVGWIPVEVTPGFYYAEYTLQQVLGQPESSVNIADDQTQDELQGSTADTLPQSDKTEEPPEDIVTRSIRVVGILLLAAIIIWVCYLLLELQALTRRNVRRKLAKKAPPEESMRLIFRDIFRIIHALGFKADENRPYESAYLFDENFDGIERIEYIQMVDRMEKTVFGEIEPSEGELAAANRFIERLLEAAYGEATLQNKLRMKYLHAFYI